MKLTRKLIPAFIMLLVSAVLMSTASFAWFAMNTQVTASGMEVKAKADSIFLEIRGKADGTEETSWSTEGTDMTANGEGVIEPVALYPAGHDTFTGSTNTEINNAIQDKENWFFKYSTDPDVATGGTDQPITGNLTDYVYHTQFDIRLNPNMVTTAANLRITRVTLPADTGISVVVVCGTAIKEFQTTNASVTDGILLPTMSGATVVDVYIYINGEDSNVTTNNAAALKGAVEIAFTVEAAT